MSYTLTTQRLKVTISGAGEAYFGRRFDWAAAIAQVELDGKARFCQLEQIDPGAKTTGGFGLMAEFYDPEACNEAGAGEEFLKPGIGVLLKRDAQKWSPYGQYMNTCPVTRGERESDGAIIFETFFAPGWNGYAYRVTREVRAQDASLMIVTTMDNLGEKPLQFEEYNHNFVSPGGVKIGPNVRLTVPGATFVDLPDPLVAKGDMLTFSRPLDDSFFINAKSVAQGPAAWEMESEIAGLRERLDVPLHRFGLWGLEHALTPEAFVAVDIAPGGSQTWTRTWDFYLK